MTFGGSLEFSPPAPEDRPRISKQAAVAAVGSEVPHKETAYVRLARFRNLDDRNASPTAMTAPVASHLVWLVVQPNIPASASGAAVPGQGPVEGKPGVADVFSAVDAQTGKSYGVWVYGVQ